MEPTDTTVNVIAYLFQNPQAMAQQMLLLAVVAVIMAIGIILYSELFLKKKVPQ